VTFEVLTKFVPDTEIAVSGDPTAKTAALVAAIVGTRLFMVKSMEFEDPPSGAEFVTTTG